MVTVAHIHDSQSVISLMRVLQDAFFSIKCILADGGYRGDIISDVFKRFGYKLQIVLRKSDDKTGFKPIGKRWIVERTFSWFDNDRRLCGKTTILRPLKPIMLDRRGKE